MTLTLDAFLFAAFLFSLRVTNYAVGTVRLVMIARNRRWIAAILAFIEALVFAIVMANVVTDLTNLVNLMAYCLGAAAGSYVGMVLEAQLFVSYSTVNIIAKELGHDIANALRDAGFGATLTQGEGRDGIVSIIRTSAISRDVPYVMKIVRKINSDVFVEMESIRPIHRGWIPGGPNRRTL